jgi:putative peptidoglycan lipid II flippase
MEKGTTAPSAGALTVVPGTEAGLPHPDRGPRRSGGGLSLSTAATYVALGTGVSRVTGLLRIVALAWALGQSHLADAFNLANITPNMLYDIVLGGVLSATFIPVFVEQLTKRSEEDAFESISAVITVSVVVLMTTTVAALVCAPAIITGLTALDTHAHPHDIQQVVAERAVATSLLRWFVIQIAAYGLFALATAVLNTRRRFVAVAWAPIINNLVCIGVLIWFGEWAGRGVGLGSVEAHRSQLILLGLGTSLGVVLQGVALLPSLRAARLQRLHWHWNPHDAALRTVIRLSGWTFGFVVANQICLFVVTLLAGTASGPDPVSSYTYAYAFLQMPYGIVAVTVMSVVTPDLSEKWSTGRTAAFVTRLARGWRSMLALIIPAAVGMLLLAKPAVALLLGHGHSTPAETADTGAALAMFALGLPGFCSYLYIVRVLQSMQRTRLAFYLYLVENAINIVLAVVLVHTLGVRGLALSLSVAYTVGALLGLALLRRWFGRLGSAAIWAPLRRVGVATVAMGVVVLVVSNLSGATHGSELLLRVVGSVVAGLIAYGAGAVLLGGRGGGGRRAGVGRRRASR